MDPKAITIIGNTGDDTTIHGLSISPDLDTVLYTLAGLEGEHGWGMKGDTHEALDQLKRLGYQAWFALGDRDLGTHLARTSWLREGVPLHEITDRIRTSLGVESRLIPMSNGSVRTKLTLADGTVRDFQEYFVKHHYSEDVVELSFEGAEVAEPAPGVIEAIQEAGRIIICPSNPSISIGPILAVPGIREAIIGRSHKVVAISPIVEGAALKGPAAELLPLLGVSPTASGVASLYSDLASAFVMDHRDAHEVGKIEALGLRVLMTETVMSDVTVATQLAREVLSFD
jgi:LPPG:FO 2-phospho-L-lactate transferase